MRLKQDIKSECDRNERCTFYISWFLINELLLHYPFRKIYRKWWLENVRKTTYFNTNWLKLVPSWTPELNWSYLRSGRIYTGIPKIQWFLCTKPTACFLPRREQNKGTKELWKKSRRIRDCSGIHPLWETLFNINRKWLSTTAKKCCGEPFWLLFQKSQ